MALATETETERDERDPVGLVNDGAYREMGPLERAELRADLFKDFVRRNEGVQEAYLAADFPDRDVMAQEYFEAFERKFDDFKEVVVSPERRVPRERAPSHIALPGGGIVRAPAGSQMRTIPERRTRVRDVRTERMYDLIKSGDLHIGDFGDDDVAALVGSIARERGDADVERQVGDYAKKRTEEAGVSQNDLRRIGGVRGALGDVSQGMNRLMQRMQESEVKAQREMLERGAGGSRRVAELEASIGQAEAVEDFAKVVNHPIVDFAYPGTGENWETIGALGANVGIATAFYRNLAKSGIGVLTRGGVARGATMETGLGALQAKELPGFAAEAAGVDPGSAAGRILTGAEMAALATAVNFAPDVVRSIRGKPREAALQNERIREALRQYGLDVEADIARRSEVPVRGTQPEEAAVEFVGIQEGIRGERIGLWNLKQPVGETPAGSTVSDAFLRENGIPVPEVPAAPNAAEAAMEARRVAPGEESGPSPSARGGEDPPPPATPKDWEAVAPRSAREAIDKVEATGKPLRQEEIDALPKVERDVLRDLPNLASDEGLQAMRARTRGVVHDEEAVDAARRLGWTEADVMALPEGRALNAEQKLAVSGIVRNAIERMNGMKPRVARARMSPDEAGNMDIIREYAAQQAKTMRLIQVERGVAAEAGRALRAHRLTMDAITTEEQALARFLNNPRVPQDAKDFAVSRLAAFDGNPEEFVRMLRGLNQATGMEKFVEMATAFKLSAIPTQVVNISTSVMRQMMQMPLRAVAGALDATVGRAWRGQRQRWLGDAAAEAYGQWQGYRGMARELKKVIQDEEYALQLRTADDFYRTRPAAIRGRPWADTWWDGFQDMVGPWVRIPFRGLSLGDVLVRRPTEHGSLYTAAYRDARAAGLKLRTREFHEHVARRLTDPDPAWLAKAAEEGTTALFQRDVTPFFRALGEVRSKYPSTKLIVPFYRTLNDLIRQGFEFTPTAPLMPSVRAQLATRGEAMDAMAKMAIGTSTLIPLAQYAMEGNITTAMPRSAPERDQFFREGKQPYSVKVGDRWYPYYRFAPYAYWFTTAGFIAEAAQREDDERISEMAADGFFMMTRAIADQSFVLGISDTLDAMTDENAFDRWWKRTLVGATVPNFLALGARSIDPKIRDTDSLVDYYMARLPGASQGLPARMDAFGQDLERPGSGWVRFFSPIVPSRAQMDVVTAEMAEIDYLLGPPAPRAYGFELEDEVYRDFHRLSGNLIFDVLSGVVTQPKWQELPPSGKEIVFNSVINRVRGRLRETMLIEERMKGRIADQIAQRDGLTVQEARRKAEQEFQTEHWQNIYQEAIQRMAPDLPALFEREEE